MSAFPRQLDLPYVFCQKSVSLVCPLPVVPISTDCSVRNVGYLEPGSVGQGLVRYGPQKIDLEQVCRPPENYTNLMSLLLFYRQETMQRLFDGKELAVIFHCLQVMLAYLKKWQKCIKLHSTNLKRIPHLQTLIFTNLYISHIESHWIQPAGTAWKKTRYENQDGVIFFWGGGGA